MAQGAWSERIIPYLTELTEFRALLEKQMNTTIIRVHSNELPNSVNPRKGGLADGV